MDYDFRQEMKLAGEVRDARLAADAARIRRATWSGAWCGFILSMAGIAAIRAYDVAVHPNAFNQDISASCEQESDDLLVQARDRSEATL